MTKIAVVVPTIREDCAKRFLKEWNEDLAGTRLILVEDNPEPTFDLDAAEHYSWADIERDLGGRSWIIPRRTSAVRSYGNWLAWKGGAEIIWNLDDDCYPEDGRRGHYQQQVTQVLGGKAGNGEWFNTLEGTGFYPRGFPYEIRAQSRPVMLHHGLWSNVPDFDGLTQKDNPDYRLRPAWRSEIVPHGQMFPMCIMNLAWRAELTPALYMLLMGRDAAGEPWGFDRFDDMWAGLFAKVICDHLGYAISSGAPSICHSKASKADDNIRLEAAGIPEHEKFWRYVRGAPLHEETVADCYRELAHHVAWYKPSHRYWQKLSEAMLIWAGLFSSRAS